MQTFDPCIPFFLIHIKVSCFNFCVDLLQPALSSQVIAFPHQLPSRKEVLAAQGTDEHSKARSEFCNLSL